MLYIAYGGPADKREDWRKALEAALEEAGLDAALEMAPQAQDAARVDYLLMAPNGAVRDLAPYRNAKALINLWAGVEEVLDNSTLPPPPPDGPPLLRMVEEGLTQGMVEYVAGHVLRVHLEIDQFQQESRARIWNERSIPLAKNRKVGILGLGELGAACAKALVALGFDVSGWSRSKKTLPGVNCHAGDGLRAFMKQAQILVALVPLTPETDGLLNEERLGWAPRGAHLINVARGGIVDEAALLAALEAGALSGATLDVMREEPPAPDNPLWGRPDVLITPHIASATRIDTAARAVAAQIARHKAGLDFQHAVDRARGY